MLVRSAFVFMLLFALDIAAPAARAQSSGWISLDGSSEGTPAEITFDGPGSDASATRGHVVIHGFWRTPMEGPSRTTFDDIVVPGMGNFTTPGVPRLPIVVLDVGVLTGASAAGLELTGVQTTVLSGYRVWPATEDPPFADGAIGTFIQDLMIYGGSTPWPPQPDAFATAPVGSSGLPPAARVSLRPFRWNPSTLQLEVLRSFDFTLFHPGSAPVVRSLPKPTIEFASSVYFNYGVIAPTVFENGFTYEGSFLFVYPPEFLPAIEPLILQKKARGFAVSQYSVLPGSSCATIRNAIRNWRNTSPVYAERYCILVGNHEQIPWCMPGDLPGFPDGVMWSDRPYAVLDDLTHFGKDVMVGRLPGTTPQQIADMVQRTLVYENAPAVDANHARVLLLADAGQSYGGYSAKQLQEKRRTTPWAYPATFATVYGEDPGVSNASLISALDAGAGLVSYVGESMPSGFFQWNLLNESFYDTEVGALANGPYTPVLWAPTAGINVPEYAPPPLMSHLGTGVLRHGMNGAVASYSCDHEQSYYGASSALNEILFTGLLGHGDRVQGQVIAGAELQAMAWWPHHDLFRYNLFGDPQMTIRLSTASLFSPPNPSVSPCVSAPCNEFQVTLTKVEDGRPLVGAKVAVHKRAVPRTLATREPDESSGASVQDQPEITASTYTDASGSATIELPPLSPGPLYYTVETGDGAACFDSLQITSGVLSVNAGRNGGLHLAARPTLVDQVTTFAFGHALVGAARLEVFDVNGRRVSGRPVPAGATHVDWEPLGAAGGRLPGGVYLARVVEGAAVRSCRVVVL